MNLVELKLSGRTAFSGKLLNVQIDEVLLPDGERSVREFIRHPGAVVVIGVLDNGCLLFERQFRYPLGRDFLELPAGKIDAGENNLAAAIRELREETGYAAANWRHLGVMHPCIGYSDERIEIFLATGLERVSGQSLDVGEFLQVLEISLESAMEMVISGEITDAKTITALFWADRVLTA